MTSKEIARILNCSASTVNNHRHTIRRKLNLAGTHDNLQSYLQALGAEK
jgi:DNA-binding CsgD family transcriptional regulator